MRKASGNELLRLVISVTEIHDAAESTHNERTRTTLHGAMGGYLAEIAERLPEEHAELREEMREINARLQADVNRLLVMRLPTIRQLRLVQECEMKLAEMDRLAKHALAVLDPRLAELYADATAS